MAAILTVGYTPNYAGSHRICFKTTGDTYCCYNDDSGSVIGVEKYTEIVLDDFELCLGTLPAAVGCAASEVQGYIQPRCIDQTSDINRSPFTASFNASVCNAYKITCEESGILEITVTDQGYGWLPGEVPTVTITDNSGYGINATAEAVMVCDNSNICSVESITIIDAGEFYYFPDQISVEISLPADPGGIPATAEVTAVDDCGTFTVPNCDGTDNPTEYELWGGDQYAINVCSGGAGPVGAKYSITPNPIDVSCCDCIKYDVINTDIANPIEFYYTDCLTQVITTQSIDAGDTLEICAVRNSVWPADPNNNQYLEYILSGIQDC